MAKTQRDLKGWLHSLCESNEGASVAGDETPSRRSTRRNKVVNEELILKRDIDDLEIKRGDSVLIQQDGASEIAIVKEIKFGNDNFIDLVVAWFIRMSDVPQENLPSETYSSDEINGNEIFATAYLDEINVKEIVDKVTIISQEEYSSKEIVIDDTNQSHVFVCRRGCDSNSEHFTEEFDYRDMHKIFLQDQSEYIEYIREKTIPPAYKKQIPSPTKSKPKVETPRREKKKSELAMAEYESMGSASESEDSDDSLVEGALSSSEEDSDEEVSLTSDEEYGKSSPSKKNKQPKALKSPRKRKLKKVEEKIPKKRGRKKKEEVLSAANSPSKLNDESRKFINNMLSPLKKRLRLKQDLSKPSLMSLPTSKRSNLKLSSHKIEFTDGPLAVDSTSEVFKELREKLHTSTRLSSLPCREDEFTSIYLNLETAIQEQTGCCLYVSGTPGLGKTATIREVIAQLQELVPMNELNDFDYLEINGLKLLTPQVAYEVLWERVSGLKVSASNAALLLESYFSNEVDDPDRKPLIVLMDELDQIVTKKQNVMYNFFNWPTYANSKLIVIAVANTMDLPERVLSNKISSRLGLRRIQFIGYTFEQLGIIIKHRLDMLTKQSKRKVEINPDAIGFASRKVASVSGDARRALTICRRAVEIAEKEFMAEEKERDGEEEEEDGKVYCVQISHISKAINETINSPISQFLTALPFAHKLVLVGVLLRMRRSGLAENSLGDIIDEMKNSLQLLTSKIRDKFLEEIDSSLTMLDVLYGEALIPNLDVVTNVRILKFKQVVSELVENGILLQQNVRGERHRLIQLNISEDEIITVLKRDKDINGML